jgi:hypothetical protein
MFRPPPRRHQPCRGQPSTAARRAAHQLRLHLLDRVGQLGRHPPKSLGPSGIRGCIIWRLHRRGMAQHGFFQRVTPPAPYLGHRGCRPRQATAHRPTPTAAAARDRVRLAHTAMNSIRALYCGSRRLLPRLFTNGHTTSILTPYRSAYRCQHATGQPRSDVHRRSPLNGMTGAPWLVFGACCARSSAWARREAARSSRSSLTVRSSSTTRA